MKIPKFVTSIVLKLLAPTVNRGVTRVKEFVVVFVSSSLATILSSKLIIELGFADSVDPKMVSIAIGASVAAILNDAYTSFRSGGTAALQKLLVDKYGLPLLVDDWFGANTAAAVNAVDEFQNAEETIKIEN